MHLAGPVGEVGECGNKGSLKTVDEGVLVGSVRGVEDPDGPRGGQTSTSGIEDGQGD
jgi:hypothetical protein